MEANITGEKAKARVRPTRHRLLMVVVLAIIGIGAVLLDTFTGQVGLLSYFAPSGPTLHVSSLVCGTWELKPVPFAGVLSDIELDGIAISPTGSVWVAGNVTTPFDSDKTYQPMLARWDNNRWHMIGLPEVNKEKAYLTSAHFVSDEDGWAVGQTLVGESLFVTDTVNILAMHWDGSNWSMSPIPDVPGSIYRVTGEIPRCVTELWLMKAVRI